MVVTLTGENAYGLKRELRTLVAAFIAEHGDIAVERLSGEDASVERLTESLQSSPFLAARKLVIITTPSANKQFSEGIETALIGLPETTDVILVEPKVDKRSGYYKMLKKTTDLHDFSAIDEVGLTTWLVDAAKEQGGAISQADARFLVERVGTDQQMLAMELEKLLTYNSDISRETIVLLSEPAPQSKIFDLLEAAFAGDLQRAIALYQDQRSQKVDPSQIIAMLAWQFKILALIESAGNMSDGDIIRVTKISPYRLQKSRAITRRLHFPHLKQLIADLLALDARSKRENIDLDEALQNYLVRLSR